MNWQIKAAVYLVVSAVSIAAIVYWLTTPFTFVSQESKTISGSDVYNRIQFHPGWNFDTWIMQQSHHGFKLSSDKWDRLAIVVDKTSRPFVARFYQFEPGPLHLGTTSQQITYSAPCYSCHANGPRAIRAKNSSLLQRIKTSLLNIRIKTYFETRSVSGHKDSLKAGVQRSHEIFKTELQLASCTRCHGPGKIRSTLRVDHLDTIRFLIKHDHMPPWPFLVSAQDSLFLQSLFTDL